MNYEEAKTLSLDPSVEALATHVVDAALVVHRELGPGLLESVYHQCLKHELQSRGLSRRSEVEIPVCFKGLRLECGFRADLILDDRVLLERKSVEGLLPIRRS